MTFKLTPAEVNVDRQLIFFSLSPFTSKLLIISFSAYFPLVVWDRFEIKKNFLIFVFFSTRLNKNNEKLLLLLFRKKKKERKERGPGPHTSHWATHIEYYTIFSSLVFCLAVFFFLLLCRSFACWKRQTVSVVLDQVTSNALSQNQDCLETLKAKPQNFLISILEHVKLLEKISFLSRKRNKLQ